MNPSQRILLNTVATYGRSLLALALALFSSRWVLAALGQSDFGLFAVVGSIIVFITFLNNVMSVSAARHFSFSIGRGDTEEVVRWFNASLGIHLAMPVVLILAGWPVGEHLIRHVLVVPDGRVEACLLVFRLSLISAFTGMVSVPFLAMFSARQRLVEPAFWGLLQAVLIFGLAWSLDRVPGDSLRIYAAGMVAIASGGHAVQSIRAWWLFPECRIERRYWFDGKKLQGIASFASWSLMGSLGKMASVQMPSFLLNLYHGTRANAAYGIATHVSNHASSLTVALMGAMSPEIIASEGRGDRSRVFDLTLRTCKFATLLVLLFAVPLLIEMDYVLKAWLRIPPDYTAALCRWMLAILLVDKLTIGHMMAVNASGRIAGYQLTLGAINLLGVPLAWLFLRAGGEPPVVCWALFIGYLVISAGRVWWARRLLQLSAWGWIRGVLVPMGLLFMGVSAVAWLPGVFMPPSFLRLLATGAISFAAMLLGGWGFALDRRERAFLTLQASKMGARLASWLGSPEDSV
ncbi:MAG: hypothetical protein PHR34_03550 [Kiritimatiellae bacterium]|nr:hypothetical protein [Kiritimatiellia bacterium]